MHYLGRRYRGRRPPVRASGVVIHVRTVKRTAEPCAIIVMGVSGTGKSTLSIQLGELLGCPVLEGDSYHSTASVAKMQAGHALTDEDRWPWLDRLGQAIGTAARESGIAVAACSALKRVYRERLAGASALPLRLVVLDTATAELARRMESRLNHFMPSSLLASQRATLERPAADECAISLDATRAPCDLANAVLDWLNSDYG